MNSFGDIHATNLEEATVASLAMVVGFLAFGISMSDMSSVISNMMAQRGRFYHRMEAVHHYMVCNKKILHFHLSFLLVILSLFSPFNQRDIWNCQRKSRCGCTTIITIFGTTTGVVSFKDSWMISHLSCVQMFQVGATNLWLKRWVINKLSQAIIAHNNNVFD